MSSIAKLTSAVADLETAANVAGLADIAHFAHRIGALHSDAGAAKSIAHLKSFVAEILRLSSEIVKHQDAQKNPDVFTAGRYFLAALGQMLVDTNTSGSPLAPTT